MSTAFARVFVAAAFLASTSMGFASAATSATPAPNVVAQASPNPAPTATPKPRFQYRGSIRAYDFNRQNATSSAQDKANRQINQASFNLGVAPHVDYNLDQNWTVGATYWYLNPFNGSCLTPQSHETAPCKVIVPSGKIPAGSELNFDDTLPGYSLSVLQEAYVQFQNQDLYFKGGNQVLNTPWAGPNGGTIGSRIMPTAYQAVDASYKLNGNWQVEAADSWQFLPRTESSFADNTLITRVAAPWGSEGYGGLASNIYNPSLKSIATTGFLYGRVGYSSPTLTANADYYGFTDISGMLWVDAKFTAPRDMLPVLHPYLQFQGGIENSTGSAVAGKIDSSLWGLQGGITVYPHIVLQGAYDYVPTQTTSLVLPAGFSCSSSTHTISVAHANKEQGLSYFLPSGGTPDCDTVAGVTTLTYGGWASPYSDGYATDPLFTTSLTQGMADRRAPGSSYMVKLIGTFDAKRLVTFVSFAGYNYNQSFMAAPTYEFNGDVTYYLNHPVPTGQYYRGFIFRFRYGDRTQPFTNSALPEFKYTRFQAEYDF